jgi:hypothetical protein
MRSMGENLGELERVKEVLKGDITHQFTDIINEAAAELNMDQADFQVLSFSGLQIQIFSLFRVADSDLFSFQGCRFRSFLFSGLQIQIFSLFRVVDSDLFSIQGCRFRSFLYSGL